MKCVILAGGQGQRLWPLSLKHYPKQFLQLQGTHSLLQVSLGLCLSLVTSKDIFVVTLQQFFEITLLQMQEIEKSFTEKNIISEPIARSTTAALALFFKGVTRSNTLSKTEPVIIFPTDLYTKDRELLLDTLIVGTQKLSQVDYVILGKKPNAAETAYGYIRTDAKGKVLEFIEKPSQKKLTRFLKEHYLFWNMGITVLTEESFWKQLRKYREDLCYCFEKDFDDLLKIYHNLLSIPLEYTLLESQADIHMMEFRGTWSDIGSWDRLFTILKKDDDNNVVSGDVVINDVKNSLIMTTTKTVLALGLRNTVVVEANNKILISSLEASSDFKSLMDNDFFQEDYRDKIKIINLNYEEFYTVKACFQIIILVVLKGQALLKQTGCHERLLVTGNVYRIADNQEYLICNNSFEDKLVVSLTYIDAEKESFVG